MKLFFKKNGILDQIIYGMNRDDIQIISRHSSWSDEGINGALQKHVYPDAQSWKRFLELLFLSLGVGFAVSGILFFFAYNWDDLHKFLKLGIVEVLILGTAFVAVFSKMSLLFKKIILTGASILVGVLIAVFGQIYQTGANAYDFFLGWTLLIAIWVFVSNFAAMWLVFIVLINTTFVLYTEQVASDWGSVQVLFTLFVINLVFLAASHLVHFVSKTFKAPFWFTAILGVAAVSISTMASIIGIWDEMQYNWVVETFLLTGAAYTAGLVYAVRTKSVFYMAIIPFSLIVISTAILIKISHEAAMFFVISLFVIISVTILIRFLIHFQKK